MTGAGTGIGKRTSLLAGYSGGLAGGRVDVARAVLYMTNLPLDVNVPFMTVMANGMPFMGRG